MQSLPTRLGKCDEILSLVSEFHPPPAFIWLVGPYSEGNAHITPQRQAENWKDHETPLCQIAGWEGIVFRVSQLSIKLCEFNA